MQNRLAGWIDLRRGFATLAGCMAGASLAAWSVDRPVAGVASGLASVIVGAFVIKAYRAPERIEVEEPGKTWSTESSERNVRVVPPAKR